MTAALTHRLADPAPASDLLDDVSGHLDYLVWAWPDLVQFRLHGTERPWSEGGAASEAERGRRAVQARAELLERTGLAPGERPAPLRTDVLDQLHAIVDATSDLARDLVEVLGRHALAVNSYPVRQPIAADPRPALQWARQWVVDRVVDTDTLERIARRLGPLVEAIARTLGDVVEGQWLAGLCPWCGGLDATTRREGARTLRVHYPSHGATGDPVVVCHGHDCDPPLTSWAGRRTWDGLPVWTQQAWPHLAERLEALEVTR